MNFGSTESEQEIIAYMDVEASEPDFIAAEMVNEAWDPVSDEYQMDHPVEPGEEALCPHCQGQLSFISV